MNKDRQDKRLAKLLTAHPLPWHVGEEHESKAEIWDANNKEVATLHASQFFEQDVNTTVRLLLGALNKERARLVTEQVTKEMTR